VAVVVDTSRLIEYLAGFPRPDLANSVADGTLVIPPLVVAEVVTGAHSTDVRLAIFELLQDVETHPTDLAHWLAVGELRRVLALKGLNVTIPDAHIAQCALDRDAVLLSGDGIFRQIAEHTLLRVSA
jgi:predicted nucleic acid-binding protein